MREIAETGAIRFIIGGDHLLMYPDAAALADVYSQGYRRHGEERDSHRLDNRSPHRVIEPVRTERLPEWLSDPLT